MKFLERIVKLKKKKTAIEPVIWTVSGWKKQVDRFQMVLLRPFLSGCDFVRLFQGERGEAIKRKRSETLIAMTVLWTSSAPVQVGGVWVGQRGGGGQCTKLLFLVSGTASGCWCVRRLWAVYLCVMMASMGWVHVWAKRGSKRQDADERWFKTEQPDKKRRVANRKGEGNGPAGLKWAVKNKEAPATRRNTNAKTKGPKGTHWPQEPRSKDQKAGGANMDRHTRTSSGLGDAPHLALCLVWLVQLFLCLDFDHFPLFGVRRVASVAVSSFVSSASSSGKKKRRTGETIGHCFAPVGAVSVNDELWIPSRWCHLPLGQSDSRELGVAGKPSASKSKKKIKKKRPAIGSQIHQLLSLRGEERIQVGFPPQHQLVCVPQWMCAAFWRESVATRKEKKLTVLIFSSFTACGVSVRSAGAWPNSALKSVSFLQFSSATKVDVCSRWRRKEVKIFVSALQASFALLMTRERGNGRKRNTLMALSAGRLLRPSCWPCFCQSRPPRPVLRAPVITISRLVTGAMNDNWRWRWPFGRHTNIRCLAPQSRVGCPRHPIPCGQANKPTEISLCLWSSRFLLLVQIGRNWKGGAQTAMMRWSAERRDGPVREKQELSLYVQNVGPCTLARPSKGLHKMKSKEVRTRASGRRSSVSRPRQKERKMEETGPPVFDLAPMGARWLFLKLTWPPTHFSRAAHGSPLPICSLSTWTPRFFLHFFCWLRPLSLCSPSDSPSLRRRPRSFQCFCVRPTCGRPKLLPQSNVWAPLANEIGAPKQKKSWNHLNIVASLLSHRSEIDQHFPENSFHHQRRRRPKFGRWRHNVHSPDFFGRISADCWGMWRGLLLCWPMTAIHWVISSPETHTPVCRQVKNGHFRSINFNEWMDRWPLSAAVIEFFPESWNWWPVRTSETTGGRPSPPISLAFGSGGSRWNQPAGSDQQSNGREEQETNRRAAAAFNSWALASDNVFDSFTLWQFSLFTASDFFHQKEEKFE